MKPQWMCKASQIRIEIATIQPGIEYGTSPTGLLRGALSLHHLAIINVAFFGRNNTVSGIACVEYMP